MTPPPLFAVIEATRLTQDDDTAAFLCFLGVRLLEMRRVLKPTGSIYLHCDHSANGYIRATMDAIFGKDNFQNEIVWYYSGGGASKRRFARKHDTIFFYSKSKKWTFNVDEIRVPHKWVDGQLRADGSERDHDKGKLPDDVIELHSIMPWAKERTGSPDQKPLALYERIIRASSKDGELVLDPFAGCATTPIASHRHGRRWVGIDRRTDGYEHIISRLHKEPGLGQLDPVANWQAPLIQGDRVLAQRLVDPPTRTDEGDTAAPELVLRVQRPKAKWELLTHAEMRDILADAQKTVGGVVCAGCGITLPLRYMELDHREPRRDGGANTIDNRVLLCGPCNRTKRENLTLSGLWRHNRGAEAMIDRGMAELAASKARDAAEQCKVEVR